MTKKIEDYLSYYIGQEVSTILGTFQLIGIEKDGVYITNKWYGRKIFSSVIIKPILRPLSDMTKEEREIFGWQEDLIFEDKSDPNQPLKTTYLVWEFIDLLKMGFDLFGLIESGLAVDKTKEVANGSN